MFSYDKGIKLNSSSLWLDAGSRVEACVVSHAHLDHAKKHSLMIATDKTIRILDKRIGKTRSIGLDFGEPYDFDGLNVTLLPAGHILGSAQILVQANGSRLLYSGDFNVQQSATAEAIEIPESDILIMESTFGQPAYSFPDRQQVSEMLCNFVAQAFRVGATPVVAGYALGKSQEAMKILGDAGYKLSVHGSVAVLARIYEEFGIRFGDWEKYKRKETDGKVLIIPRIAIRSRMVKRLQSCRKMQPPKLPLKFSFCLRLPSRVMFSMTTSAVRSLVSSGNKEAAVGFPVSHRFFRSPPLSLKRLPFRAISVRLMTS